MPRKEVIEKVTSLARETADDFGVELVDVQLLGSGPGQILRVTIDREGGVSLEDCQRVSRELEALLDVEDPIPGRYTLEVSSPGLDRPLKKREDFVKYRGRKARVVLRSAIDDRSFLVGRIAGVEGDDVLLDTGRKKVRIPLADIKSSRLEIEF